MGILNFCKECGARRVSDVKIQLEKLFTNKQITAHLCGICSAPLWVAENIKIQFQECSGDTNVSEVTVVSTVKSTIDTETGGEATDHQKNGDGCQEEKYTSRADNKRLTRLCTGTIEPQNHRENESGDDFDNESIDVPFYLEVESQDSNSDEGEDDSSKMLQGKKNTVKKISSLSVEAGPKTGKKQKRIKKESQPHQQIDQDSNSDERVDDLSKMFEGKKNTIKKISSLSVEAGQKTGKKQKRIEKVSQPHQEIKLTKDQFDMYRSLDPKILAMLDVDEEEILTKTLKCKECKGSFRQLYVFMRHISSHTGEKLSIAKPYICQICENRFVSMTEFKIHMARHTTQKFVCQWVNCFATFGCKRYLTKHVKRQHRTGIKERKFVCTADKCKYRTAFPFSFKLHQNTHTNTRPYKCNYCDRCFNNPNCKRSHEANKHSNSKDHHHICEICGYSTSKKPDLTKHQRIHFGEKPFACNQCDYRSNRRDNLVKHLRIHSGNKPYKCFCCELVFVSLKACKNHEKKHSPRQPQPTAYQEGRGDAQTGKHFSRDENNFLCNETNKILPNNDAQSVDRNHPVSTSDETLEVTSHPVACAYNAGHSNIPALAEPSQQCQTAQAKTQSEESIGAVSFLQHLQQM